jgi:hypothetical protein
MLEYPVAYLVKIFLVFFALLVHFVALRQVYGNAVGLQKARGLLGLRLKRSATGSKIFSIEERGEFICFYFAPIAHPVG